MLVTIVYMSHDVFCFFLPLQTLSSILFANIFVNSNFIFLKKKKERCDFITKHFTDFAMLYVSLLVLIMEGKFKIKQS